jgi:hypothetical protein
VLSKGTPLRALYAYDVPRSPAVELSILAMVALAIPEKAAHGDTTAEMARCARATGGAAEHSVKSSDSVRALKNDSEEPSRSTKKRGWMRSLGMGVRVG